jgi:hypothetical protein
MLKNSRNRLYIIIGAVGLPVLTATVYYAAGGASREARAGNADLRDLADPVDLRPASQAPVRLLPLASCPWKRGADTFVPAVLTPARLPWNRELVVDVSTRLQPAQMPWAEQRANAYVPVFLPSAALPWRY